MIDVFLKQENYYFWFQILEYHQSKQDPTATTSKDMNHWCKIEKSSQNMSEKQVSYLMNKKESHLRSWPTTAS